MCTIQSRNIHLLLITAIAFISTRPVIVWGNYKPAFAFLAVILVFTFIGTTKKLQLTRLLFGVFIFSLVGAYSYISGTSFFWGFLLSFYIFVLLILSKDERVITFKYFRNIVVISLIPGLILWFLHHLTGDSTLFSLGLVPDGIVPNQLKIENGERYALFPFSVVLLDPVITLPVYRFCGMYDEPGVVGTLAALFLVADKVQLNKKANMVFFISGLISFSLAFFVIILIYYLCMFRHHYIKILTVATMLVMLFMVFVPKDSFVHTILLNRLTISSEGSWKGDNRESSNIKVGFDEWSNSEPMQFFTGLNTLEQGAGASWKMIFISTGVVGCLLILSILFFPIFPSIGSMNYASFVFVLVFIASIYQRPDVINPSMLLLFYTGFYQLLSTNKGYALPTETAGIYKSSSSGKHVIVGNNICTGK